MQEIDNEVLRCMRTRRSIRRFTDRQIPEDLLAAILSAGLYAPSAGGRQGVLFLVSQDRQANEILGRINKEAYTGGYSTTDSYISRDQPSIVDDRSLSSGFYGAPTVVNLLGPSDFLYGESDCSVAAQNMMLAAHSLGIGSCMIGRAFEAFSSEYGRCILADLGIEDRFIGFYQVALGYPETEPPEAGPRKDGRVFRIPGGANCSRSN